MAKTGEQRGAKYEAKLDGEIVAKRITAQRQTMIDANVAQQILMCAKTEGLRTILDDNNIDPLDFVKYNAVVMALYKQSRTYANVPTTRAEQGNLLLDYWEARGLTPAVLTDISTMFNFSRT